MADSGKSLRYLLIIFCLLPLSNEVNTDNAHDVAGEKKTTLASSVQGWDNVSTSVDGDVNTCMSTENELQPWWSLDLGDSNDFTIVGVHIHAGETYLEHMEVWVGPNPGTEKGNAFCNRYKPTSARDSAADVTCVVPTKGRYITILVLERAQLKLCEVKIYECVQGFFGKECSKECHCVDGPEVCPKDSGQCQCSSGWTGASCQKVCDPGTWGEDCLGQCHCEGGQACNITTGLCPTDKCEPDWVGQRCQTEVPDMSGDLYRPIAREKTSLSIMLEWRAWMGRVDTDARLVYWIEYKPYRPKLVGQEHHFAPNWLRPRVHVEANGEAYQQATVPGLTTNTNYIFRVIPYLRLPNREPKQGEPSIEGGPYKTRCTGPDPPTIRNVEPIVDKSTDPPKALLHVRWQAPSRHFVNCDNIKIFKISYQLETLTERGEWKSIWASNTMNNRNITGIKFNARYNVKVTAVNNEDLTSDSPVVEGVTVADFAVSSVLQPDEKMNGLVVGVVITLIVVLAFCVLGFLYRRRRRNKYASVPFSEDGHLKSLPRGQAEIPTTNANATVVKVNIPDSSSNSDMNDSGVVDGSASENTPSSVATDGLESSMINSQEEKNPFPRVTQPDVDRSIQIKSLEEYVMQRRQNDCEGLRKEYEEIPMGFIDRYDQGRLSENKHKNRFINIIAYDHSRVLLERVDGDPESDYINANWIDGYNKPREYVAAQGCNKYTIQDMWRMVWQLNSGRIVMVTNLVENGKRKCDQYWPDSGEKTYTGIEVRIVDTEQTSDFIIRTFELQQGDEKRSVKQFHFIAWPDHGVPNRAGPIIAFRRKVRSYDESHDGPMLIHCSAGVGRTGTFIALDYLLDRAKVEGIVDIYGLVWDMRRNRVNMIQTVEQYIFVYDALLEALKAGNTAIGCSEFRDEFKRLTTMDESKGKTPLQEQYENLQLMSPKVRPEDCKSGSLAENIDKNRFKEILPADRHRPYLMVRVEGTNDYINAVFLDGFLKRNSYIITQMPLPHTVIDFWRMVYEHGCSSIVMLNSMEDADESYGQYWLDEEGCECGPFVIEPVPSDNNTHKDVHVRELKLTYEPQSPSVMPSRKEEKPRMIGQFHLKGWPRDGAVPKSKAALIHLIELVERWQQKTGDGPVLVHCHDGVTKSGLFTAVSCIWEKMKVDQEVDIFHAVKHLRYHRPQILQDLEQYQFCYEMVLAYMSEFETYANFR